MSPAENDWLSIAWTQLWQVTLLIAAVTLVARLVAAHRPQLAYALWLVVLLKCLTPPLWSSPTGAFCWLQPSAGTVAHEGRGTAEVVLVPAGAATALSRADFGCPRADNNENSWYSGFEAFHPAALLAAIWGLGIAVALAAMAAQWRRHCQAPTTGRRRGQHSVRGHVGRFGPPAEDPAPRAAGG